MGFFSMIADMASDFDRDYRNGDCDDNEETMNDDDYSPTSWDRHPWESDEDYKDRMDDQVSMMGGD